MTSHDLTSCCSISRRNFLRSASAVLAAGPILSEAHFAHAAVPEFSMKGIYLDANENPLGPSENARKAMATNILPNGGRYAPPLYFDLMKLYATSRSIPAPVRRFTTLSSPSSRRRRASSTETPPTKPLKAPPRSPRLPLFSSVP
jgi:histidinol-phosphate aminotransferase